MESDKEQNQMTEKELQDEKKERRSIRIGAIIATVVMFVPVCSALYKLTERVMDFWPQTGYIYFVYLYMWVFLFALLGATGWLFGETVWFIIVDLLRHNVQGERYKLYDKRSDAIYDNLAKHLFFVIKGWILLWMLLVPLLIPIMESQLQWMYIVICIFICFVLVVRMVRLCIKRKEIKLNIHDWLLRLKLLVIWLVISVLLFLFCFPFMRTAKMSLIIDYQSNGMITVMTQSKTSFSRLTILVYDDSDRLIVEKNVEEDELLRARELGKVDFQNDEGKEIGTAMLYSEDILHWKFQYALNDLKLAPGIYKICIIVHQGQKTAEMFNEVRVSGSGYTYGCDRIEKEY